MFSALLERDGTSGRLVLAAVAGLTFATACPGDQRRPGGVTGHRGRRLLGAPVHRRVALRRIGLLAVLAGAFQACYFTAVSLTTVGLATLVTIGTAPVVVVAVETLRGRARRGSPPIVVLALLGLGLASLLVWALSATSSFVVGGLLLAVPAAVLGRMAFPVTFSGVGLLALFAVLPTALAYTAYFRGLGAATSPGTGAVLALLEPLTAAVLAAVVLGERLGVTGTVGALLLAVAVLLAARADRG